MTRDVTSSSNLYVTWRWGTAHAEHYTAVKKKVIPCAYVRIDKQKASRSKQKSY